MALFGVYIELEFGGVGFCGGRKTGEFGKKRSEQGENPNNKFNPYETASTGMEPGLQRCEASTYPLCLNHALYFTPYKRADKEAGNEPK